MTDILYLYNSRIHAFIFYFRNAFNCPYTLDCLARIEMGKGQQVQSKLQTYVAFSFLGEALRGLKSFS